MNIKQITEAMRFEDSDQLTNLITAIRTADSDQIVSLLEDIRNAVKKDVIEDVMIDLKDAGEKDAADFIKENY